MRVKGLGSVRLLSPDAFGAVVRWHGMVCLVEAVAHIRGKRLVSPSPLQGHVLSDLRPATRPFLGPGVGICQTHTRMTCKTFRSLGSKWAHGHFYLTLVTKASDWSPQAGDTCSLSELLSSPATDWVPGRLVSWSCCCTQPVASLTM